MFWPVTNTTLELFLKTRIYPINWIEKSIYWRKFRIQSNLLKTFLSTISWPEYFELSLWCCAFSVSAHWLSSSCLLGCPLKPLPLKIQFVFYHFMVILLKRATFQELPSHCSAQHLLSLSKLVSSSSPFFSQVTSAVVSPMRSCPKDLLDSSLSLRSLHLIHPTYAP